MLSRRALVATSERLRGKQDMDTIENRAARFPCVHGDCTCVITGIQERPFSWYRFVGIGLSLP